MTPRRLPPLPSPNAHSPFTHPCPFASPHLPIFPLSPSPPEEHPGPALVVVRRAPPRGPRPGLRAGGAVAPCRSRGASPVSDVIVRTPLQYLDRATQALRDLGLVPERAEDAPVNA